MKENNLPIRCIYCNRRLFDVAVDPSAHAVVTIKCKCGNKMRIELAHPIKSCIIESEDRVNTYPQSNPSQGQ